MVRIDLRMLRVGTEGKCHVKSFPYKSVDANNIKVIQETTVMNFRK